MEDAGLISLNVHMGGLLPLLSSSDVRIVLNHSDCKLSDIDSSLELVLHGISAVILGDGVSMIAQFGLEFFELKARKRNEIVQGVWNEESHDSYRERMV